MNRRSFSHLSEARAFENNKKKQKSPQLYVYLMMPSKAKVVASRKPYIVVWERLDLV